MYCPEFSTCVDQSTNEDPLAECVCQFGRVKNPKTKQCINPTKPPPTERPNPTLEVNDITLIDTLIMFLIVIDNII